MHRNINKSWAVWRRLGKMLQQEGKDSRVSALFYREVIQAILLFRSESWALLDATIKVMEGSHVGF